MPFESNRPDKRPGRFFSRGIGTLKTMNETSLDIWTIGHSTRTAEEFLALLAAHRIAALADVRRFSASRKFPHFNQIALRRTLPQAGIEYAEFPELGGRRRPRPDSPDTVWRNASFRGYADHMQSEEFRAGIERLLDLARRRATAVMCAEAVWWRCHRALIADYLKARGVAVHHILNSQKAPEHPYTSAARIFEGRLTYSPAE